MSAQSGPNSGGDLSDMAVEGTTVPSDAAQPRVIPSKPRPDQIASADDPNQMGGTNLADAATNAQDIPRVRVPDLQWLKLTTRSPQKIQPLPTS
jgi:hypothetical protein